jgi:hypothetical protein
MGLIGEGVEAPLQEPLDPAADAGLADPQMGSDPGDTPAGVTEAYHLQAVSRPGLHSPFVGPTLQLLPLSVRQSHSIHSVPSHTSFLHTYFNNLLNQNLYNIAEVNIIMSDMK